VQARFTDNWITAGIPLTGGYALSCYADWQFDQWQRDTWP
jgi:hypothetical protein